jgi:hypothetical protein
MRLPVLVAGGSIASLLGSDELRRRRDQWRIAASYDRTDSGCLAQRMSPIVTRLLSWPRVCRVDGESRGAISEDYFCGVCNAPLH